MVEFDPKAVMWQLRWLNPDNIPQHTGDAEAWTEVIPTWNQSMADRLAELQSYRYKGKQCYEVRGLYAKEDL